MPKLNYIPKDFYGEYKPHKTFFQTYHGCGPVNEDGTRILCKKQQKCKFTTNNPFLKLPEHIGFKIETRFMEMRKRTASKRDIDKYFKTTN